MPTRDKSKDAPKAKVTTLSKPSGSTPKPAKATPSATSRDVRGLETENPQVAIRGDVHLVGSG